jgi:CHAD domain-containing protein
MVLKQPVDREMLHRFRVQVKRMKAVWAIHPIGNMIDFKLSFPNISKLYKQAAQVRDKQMVLSCLETLPDFKQTKELEKILQNSIKKHRKNFIEKVKLRISRYGVYEDNRFFAGYFKAASATLIRQNRKEFKLQTIQMLSEETGKNPKELHNLRRQCKYLLFQCMAFHSNGSNNDTGLTKEALDHLQHKLGTWHDWWNTVDWLDNLKVDEKNTLSLQPLLKQATKKEELLRRDVLKEIKTILIGIKMQAVNKV